MIFSALILNVFLLTEVFAMLPRAARPNSHNPLQQVRHMDQRVARSKTNFIGKYGHDGPLRRSNYILRINVPNENQTEFNDKNSKEERIQYLKYIEARPNLKYVKSKNLTRELQKVNKIFSQDYKFDIGREDDRSDSNPVSEDDSYDSSQNDRNDKVSKPDELDELLNALRSKVNGNDRSDSNPVSEDDSSQNDRNGKETILFSRQGKLPESNVKGNDRSGSNPVSEDDSYDSQNDRNGKVLRQGELDKLLTVLRSKVNANDRSDSNPVSEDDSYDSSQNDRNSKVLLLRQGGSDKFIIALNGDVNGNDRSDSNPVSEDDSYDSSQNDRNGKVLRQGNLDKLLNVLRSKLNVNDRSDSNPVSKDDSYDSSQNDRNGKEQLLVFRQGNVNENKPKGNDRSDSNPVSEDDSYDSSQNDRTGKGQGDLDKLLNVLRSKVNGNDRSDSNPVSEEDSYDSSQNDRRGDKTALRQGNLPLSLLMMRQAVGKKINAKLTPKQMTGQELLSEELEVDSNKYDNNGMIYLSRPDEKNEERELNVMMNRVAAAGQDAANIGRQPRKHKRHKDPLEREIHPKYDMNGMMYLSEPDGNNSERALSVLLNKVVKYHQEGKKALRGTSLVEIFDPDEIKLMEDAVYTQTVEETQNGRENNQNGRRFNFYRPGKVPPDNSRRDETKHILGDLFNFNGSLVNMTVPANKTTGNANFNGYLTSSLTGNDTTPTTPFNFFKGLKLNSTTLASLAHDENSSVVYFSTEKPNYKFRSLGELTQRNKVKKHYISPKIFEIYDLLI